LPVYWNIEKRWWRKSAARPGPSAAVPAWSSFSTFIA